MPPRYAYWTILVDGQPTAFRAAEPDELLPTLKRLQVKQPGALMKWFERGRLWESRDEAKDKLRAGYTVGADGALVPPDATAGRGRGWRPGGEHKDPREKYQLAKKAKWQKFKQMVRARPGHGPKPGDRAEAPIDAVLGDAAFDDPAFDPAAFKDVTSEYLEDDSSPKSATPDEAAPPSTDWRGRPKPVGAAPARAKIDRPKPAWRDTPGGGDRAAARPGSKPRSDARGPKPEWKTRPDARGPKPEWKTRPDTRGPKPEWKTRPDTRGPKPEWKARPDARGPKPAWRDRPAPEGRPRDDRPAGDRPWSGRPKPAWRDTPAGDRGGVKPAWNRGPKPEWKGPRPEGRGPKPAWRDKPAPAGRARDDKPGGAKPWSDRPKPAWRDTPAGDRGGAKPASNRGPKPEWKGPRPEGRAPKREWKKPGSSAGGGRRYSGPKKKP